MKIIATARFTPGNIRHVLDIVVQVKLFAKVRRSQSIVVDHARAHVAVDTGELRDTIASGPINDDGKRVVGQVVATAAHAGFVETGTGRRGALSAGAADVPYNLNWPGMVAQPYLRPALDTARDEVLEEFKG